MSQLNAEHLNQINQLNPQQQQQQLVEKMKHTMGVNLASFLRNHKLLKQRSGELQGKGSVDFFKYKRAERLLLSDEYKALFSNPKNNLPVVKNAAEAKAAFFLIIKAQLVIPGQKLHTAEAREKDLKPKKGSPCFLPMTRAELSPGEYYIWLYKKRGLKDVALSVGIVLGVLTVILFPLWPVFMRQGVVYISQFVLGLFALLLATAVVRLILYVISLVLLPKGFWLLPNLFADVGFFDSFKPLYGFDEKKRKKRRTKKSVENVTADTAAVTTETAGTTETTGTTSSTTENAQTSESSAETIPKVTDSQTTSSNPNKTTTSKRKAKQGGKGKGSS